MHQNLAALLALQADDDVLSELEAAVESFAPRITELDRQLNSAVAEEARARAALDEAERREHELQMKTDEQKQLYERSMSQLEAVRKAREATAAMTQAEITRRFLQEMEKETQAAVARVVDLRARLKEKQEELETLQMEQSELRGGMQEQIAALRLQVQAAREKRKATSSHVPRALLQKYDKLRVRRASTSVFAILGSSCGNCDMAVPIHRRNMLGSSGGVEACEACGVLLYLAE